MRHQVLCMKIIIFPSKRMKINPKNIYALSKSRMKKFLLSIVIIINLKCTGLRFFTVFGEWVGQI